MMPDHVADLLEAYRQSPEPSLKLTTYFRIYAELFAHLRGTDCTFIEVGVLNGGSLFMWRSWLGPRARIIGIDLNPAAAQWRDHGFEIHIGDQGDPAFWRETLRRIGQFDALLDDGGHQAFQQIVTVTEALRASRGPAVVAVEDTHTSMMKAFASHGGRSFLNYAKAATDLLQATSENLHPGEFPPVVNAEMVDLFARVHSIQFYAGIVALRVDGAPIPVPELVWNRPAETPAADFRYAGHTHGVETLWPDPFGRTKVTVPGKQD